MDWRNYQFWRKKLFRMDEETAKFDLLVQRTKQQIAVREKLRRSIKLLEGTPSNTQKVFGWGSKFGNSGNFRKNLFFWKKFR